MNWPKDRIAGNFARSASTYDLHAQAQQRAAQALLAEVERQRQHLPPGPVLEIGCGTGGLSEGLARLLPEREIWFTDLSGELLAWCRRRLGDGGPQGERLHWEVLDGEAGPLRSGYALVASGMALHWCADWAGALRRWLEALRPGGWLACSFQEAASFPEWRAQCLCLGLPCTANPFPSLEQVQQVLAGQPGRCWAQEERGRYASPWDFFRSLKDTGTATSLRGDHLGAGDFRRLMRAWDRACPAGVELSGQIGYAAVQR